MQFVLSDVIFGYLGGLLIGGSAAVLLLINGRIAGVSGIAGSLLRLVTAAKADGGASGAPKGAGENAAFIAGLIGAPLVYAFVAGAPAITLAVSAPVIVVGGVLVGIGTRMGAGCTSGHGVCGMTRFSPRSFVAVAVFMAFGAATATLIGG